MLKMAEVWEVVTKSSGWSNRTKELWDSVYQMGIKYQVTRNTQTLGSRGQTSAASCFRGISLLGVWAGAHIHSCVAYAASVCYDSGMPSLTLSPFCSASSPGHPRVPPHLNCVFSSITCHTWRCTFLKREHKTVQVHRTHLGLFQ